MGMRASIMVVGPLGILRKHDALMYDDDYYEGCDDDLVVVGHLISAVTTRESKVLAAIVGVDPWDFAGHQLKDLPRWCWCAVERDFPIGCKYAVDVYDHLAGLIQELPWVDIWYLPNG